MTIEQIKKQHDIMLHKETYSSMDPSEKAIIDAYNKSTLQDKLYVNNYGAGGITFNTEDSKQFYVMLDPEYDEKGWEKPRSRNGKYRLLEMGNETEEPPVQTLEEIFRELERLLIT